jgi:hypothetical protein
MLLCVPVHAAVCAQGPGLCSQVSGKPRLSMYGYQAVAAKQLLPLLACHLQGCATQLASLLRLRINVGKTAK